MPKQDEKIKTQKKRAQQLLRALKKLFPHPKMALKYENNWELLVAVILSAQCTDKKVNEVTEKLFKKYRTLNEYVQANSKEFEKDVHSTGFFRNKTKNILASAKIVKEKFQGKVPHTMEELLTLPGVARKTANIILGNAFGIVEGIAVDTHVIRLSHRFGLTKEHNPEKIEKNLMALFPEKEWFTLTYRLIEYGRKYCSARTCEVNHPLHRFDARVK
ncbi:MAG: endonuclease III [Parcubacteria group bacterium]|nr:endonuclease III [Parcubacteria group bacterium]